MPNKRMYVDPVSTRSISLPSTLWPVIDEAAHEKDMSRSAFVAKILAAEVNQTIRYNPIKTGAILR